MKMKFRASLSKTYQYKGGMGRKHVSVGAEDTGTDGALEVEGVIVGVVEVEGAIVGARVRSFSFFFLPSARLRGVEEAEAAPLSLALDSSLVVILPSMMPWQLLPSMTRSEDIKKNLR